MKIPDTIQTIIAQCGGRGLAGAFAYIGAHDLRYRCPEPDGEYRGGAPSKLTVENGQGFVEYEVGLSCRVNGKPGHRWMLIITYEPDDTYAVWLVEGHRGRQPDTMVLACERDVYCDTLQNVIEVAYDQAIRNHNSGFIPLS